MNLDRRVMFLVALLAACLSAGCAGNLAGTATPKQGAASAPRREFVKSEHLCADLVNRKPDLAAVKKDLQDLLSNDPYAVVVRYYRVPAKTMPRSDALAGTKKVMVISTTPDGFHSLYLANLEVSDSRISAGDNVYLEFDDLLDHEMRFEPASRAYDHEYGVAVSDVIAFNFTPEDFTRCIADELLYIQQVMRRREMADALAAFRPVAEQYRAMPDKPQVSEEQRKYIVQANSMTQQKEFAKAMDLYRKALDVGPVSFPAAYYNMALIAAQQRNFFGAILNMQKYLLLVPQAEDARSAQDKIYEWQAKVGE